MEVRGWKDASSSRETLRMVQAGRRSHVIVGSAQSCEHAYADPTAPFYSLSIEHQKAHSCAELYPVGYPLRTSIRGGSRSISHTSGQVPVSSRTRTRVCAGTRVPEQRTELFTGIKADMHTEKSGEKKHERNGMGFVAMMRRSSCV